LTFRVNQSLAKTSASVNYPSARPPRLTQIDAPFSSRLSRDSIAIERIKPGHPQQNGRHERMHLTLRKEATRPPGFNSLQQQARFDAFVCEFNAERPHEALGMKYPAELYATSTRRYDGLPELTYPFHDRDVLVTACGRLCLHRKSINISTVLAGQRLGIKEVDEGIWLASFMLLRSWILRPGAENLATPRQPVRHEAVTHVLGTLCYLCLRAGQAKGGGDGVRQMPLKYKSFLKLFPSYP
jgi:hypothetical protein